MARIILTLVAVLAMSLTTFADTFSFDPTVKYRIEAYISYGSSVALGENHGINSPLCVATSSTTDSDCYWYIQEHKSGKYALRNAKTGQYIAWDEVRADNPIRRYIHMSDAMTGDSCLWTIGEYADGIYYFQNVAAPDYCFNVRTGSFALGAYSQGPNVSATNELFYLYKEDGSAYDPQKDYNTSCGVDADGFYWTTAILDNPVVCTTDLSDPVYYYIENVRSGLYVDPSGEALAEVSEQPESRFYFVEATDGVQIRVEGGKYVSGLIPNAYSTTDSDVSIVSGTPASSDHIWGIKYAEDDTYPGYSIGVVTCSQNDNRNQRVRNGQVYWNDFHQYGVCFYSVDGGSTFAFKTSDIRHRDYLAELGYVIPSDSAGPIVPVGPGPEDPEDPKDETDIEPIKGDVLHVYRADGKIDAIPQTYIQNVEENRDSIVIYTTNNGPVYEYARYEVDSLSTALPANLPQFNSYKFNNKFNRHLISDAEGVFMGDSLILLNPICIGKRLRPSFKLEVDVQAFIGDSLQSSKETRVRFDEDVVYTVARRGHTVLRRTYGGTYKVRPYGREVTVRADFATDHSTSTYQVPTVYITTDDGTSINSKYYWWEGKIRIDGAGVFPDFPETPMQIKGRGNTSWTSTGKAPYHMKFAEALKPFGLTKGKHWNLIANAQSRSMTTNAIAMKMAQLVETAGYNHEIPIELYINGEYRGSYNFTEKVGLGNNSLDAEDETTAVLLELDSYYDETYKFRTTNYSLPTNIKEPDFSEGLTKLTQAMIQSDFNKGITALYNGEDISPYFDLDYLARFLFVDDYAFNSEFMHPKSTFLYKENVMDSDQKYIFGPVWDFDWSYGYQYSGTYFTMAPTTDFWTRVSMEASTWTRDMRYCGENFDQEYFRLWNKFMTDGSLQELVEFCDDYYNFAAPSFTHNNSKWGNGDANTYATVTTNAKTWLENRAKYIYDYLANTLGYSNLGYLDDGSGKILVGDVNKDGAVTTADVVCVLNYILGLPNEEFDYDQADTDNNSMISIGDAMGVLTLATDVPVSSRAFYALPEADAVISTGLVSQNADGVTVPLTINIADGNYSGLQFDLKIPAGMHVEDLDISQSIPDFDVEISELNSEDYADQSVDRYRVSIYAPATHKFPKGTSNLVLQLGWGGSEAQSKVLSATLANVMFVSSLGEDERSASRSAEFCSNDLTGINSAVLLAQQEGNQLTFNATGDSVLPIYSVDGRIFRVYNIHSGKQTISLPYGIYIINKQKVIVH